MRCSFRQPRHHATVSPLQRPQCEHHRGHCLRCLMSRHPSLLGQQQCCHLRTTTILSIITYQSSIINLAITPLPITAHSVINLAITPLPIIHLSSMINLAITHLPIITHLSLVINLAIIPLLITTHRSSTWRSPLYPSSFIQ